MQCKVHIQSNQARGLESDFASFSINYGELLFTDDDVFAGLDDIDPSKIVPHDGKNGRVSTQNTRHLLPDSLYHVHMSQTFTIL